MNPAAVKVGHAAACRRPPLKTSDHPKGVRHYCPECGHDRIAYGPAAPQALPLPTSGYVCREHLEQAVTWRGHGCTLCIKTKRRKPTGPSDTTEMENHR